MDGHIYQLDDNCIDKMTIVASKMIGRGSVLLSKDMEHYSSYLEKKRLNPNTTEDSILELLCMGVLWHSYGKDALGINPITRSILKNISFVRQRVPKLKSIMNPLKGFFLTLSAERNPLFTNSEYKHLNLMTFNNLGKLIRYLESMDEYHQEVVRLKRWYDYIETIGVEHHIRFFLKLQQLTSEFLIEADEQLGYYLSGINYYRIHEHPKRRYYEDYHFTGKYREEYYLNMVGASLLNMAYRDEFLEAYTKMILLPTCMRALPKGHCKAKSYGNWLKCAHCHKGCQVSEVSKLGDKNGYVVYMVGHSSSISSEGSDTSKMSQGMGIIGISCILNLVSGGWMLREQGVAAQCVLLNFSGCKNHWDDEGIVTNIFIKQLKERMNIGVN